ELAECIGAFAVPDGTTSNLGSMRLRAKESRGPSELSAMGFYQVQVVPLLTNLSMRNKHLAAYRDRVVPAATGRVLEVGIGSGLNLPRYSPHLQQVIGLEPSPKLLNLAQHVGRQSFPVDLIEGSAEEIPLEDASVDTVVTTWHTYLPRIRVQ